MNLDQKIKAELERDTPDVEKILAQDDGLFDMLFATFRSGIRAWVIVINLVTLVVTGLLFWTGYEFFTSGGLQDQVFWGVCLLLALNAQIALKQWIWMEMNRTSVIKEVKRVELAIARLQSQRTS